MPTFGGETVYQIYIKSFCDGRGTGKGDLKGIIGKLDYLLFLGVKYVWITPFFVSPQVDNGYDVADYLAVNPQYGTMEEVEILIAEARKRDIGIILDMVFNHTSTNHAWFRKAISGDKRYQDYYFFRSGKAPGVPPTNWASKFGGSAWKYVLSLDKWYLHLFSTEQADLNWDNIEVREALKDVLRFWQRKGVVGFRFDVINLVSKPDSFQDDLDGDGRRFYTDGPCIHRYLAELSHDCGLKDYLTVGEMSSTSLENCISYGKELSMAFSFLHLKVDYNDGDKWRVKPFRPKVLFDLLDEWQKGMQEGDAWNTLFWSNHDQPRIVSRFGNDGPYWRQSAKMLATAMYLLRGTPFIFQGEEIGMTNAGFTSIDEYRDVESLTMYRIMREEGWSEKDIITTLGERSRDNSRTPMQWDTSPLAGFSSHEPWIAINPNHSYVNVETEKADPDSILWWYKRLIALRKRSVTIQSGCYERLDFANTMVFAYRRIGEDGTYTILCNFTGGEASFNTIPSGNIVMSNYSDPPAPGLLRPFEAVVYHVQKEKTKA